MNQTRKINKREQRDTSLRRQKEKSLKQNVTWRCLLGVREKKGVQKKLFYLCYPRILEAIIKHGQTG